MLPPRVCKVTHQVAILADTSPSVVALATNASTAAIAWVAVKGLPHRHGRHIV